MSPKRPDPDRLAEAGKCGVCGAKIVRGPDQRGRVATVDVTPVDAYGELTGHTGGRVSYKLAWGPGLVLIRRTDRDLVRRPAGFNRDRIVLSHLCPTASEGNPL